MASAAEQMAANLSWGALGKATELRQRIWFTLGLLIIYRLGTYIPVPGIDGAALRNFMDQAQAGIGGILSMFTGGALGRMGVFALGIMPYISASIIVQLLASMVPSLEQLKKEGEAGRKKINQYTRYGTVALALFQAWGLAVSLEHGNLAHEPGLFFRASVVITLVGGTMFLMWLGEQITARHRQRHQPYHLRRHRRGNPGPPGAVPGAGPLGRGLDPGDPGRDRDGRGRHRLRRLHGTRAAQDPHPVSSPPGGHEDL